LIGIDKRYHHITGVGCTVDQDQAMVEICDRYNLAQGEVTDLAEWITSLAGRRCVINSPTIEMISKVDMVDLDERLEFEGDIHNFLVD
jgi:hypothetical protein